ncbi:glycosyltransferase family 2 protein [Herbiconiux sp. P17]|uniref:glycosyltransferase family 2 protein n=1 Tax=Herbiconiux wuyangfengii TaxID=3342794 RepID=UPI0035B92A1B
MTVPEFTVRTSIVVVTYNSAEDIRDCVEAMRATDDAEIVVVDNASPDGSQELLVELQREGLIDTLILSPENLGFAKGVNAGIRASKGRDVLLLNPDASLGVESLTALRTFAESRSDVGIVAPVVDSGPTVDVMSAGEQPTLWPMFTHYAGLSRVFADNPRFRGRHLFRSRHAGQEHVVGWSSGCCLYIPRRTIDRVGLLSERWFMYGEDIEYCHRVSKAGLKVVVTPLAHAVHAVGASVNSAPGTISTMWAENTYDYYVTEFRPGPIRKFFWRLVFSGGLLSRSVVFRLKARRDRSSKNILLARATRFEAFSAAVWRAKPR